MERLALIDSNEDDRGDDQGQKGGGNDEEEANHDDGDVAMTAMPAATTARCDSKLRCLLLGMASLVCIISAVHMGAARKSNRNETGITELPLEQLGVPKNKNNGHIMRLNMTHVLEEAQIPPPHAPWHILPSSLSSLRFGVDDTFDAPHNHTNSSLYSSSSSRNSSRNRSSSSSSMLRSTEYQIQRELTTLNTEKDLRDRSVHRPKLYAIKNGTLLGVTKQQEYWREHDKSAYVTRIKPFGQMTQSALDIARQIVEQPYNANTSTMSRLTARQQQLMRTLVAHPQPNNNSMTIPILLRHRDWGGCQYTEGADHTNKEQEIGNHNLDYPQFTFAMTNHPKERFDKCVAFAMPCYAMWHQLTSSCSYVPQDNDSLPSNRKSNQTENTISAIPNNSQNNTSNHTITSNGVDDGNNGMVYPPAQYLNSHKVDGWDIRLEQQSRNFAWADKINKVVWRGSTTGGNSDPNDDDNAAATTEAHAELYGSTSTIPSTSEQTTTRNWRDLPRAQAVQIAMDFPDIMDVKFHHITKDWTADEVAEIKQELGGIGSQMSFAKFGSYKAILDINGNSWSSRLGHLFCLNSVILRVDRSVVNYFESTNTRSTQGTNVNTSDASPVSLDGKMVPLVGELQPNVHYIPIHANFSNFVEQVQWVVDPANDVQVQNIVHNANQWCRQKMTVTQFALDQLWVILGYLDLILKLSEDDQDRDDDGGNQATSWLDQWQDLAGDGDNAWMPMLDEPTIFESEVKILN